MTIPTYLPYFIAAGTVAVLTAIFMVSAGRLPTRIGQLRIARERFACQRSSSSAG
jgi:hypothetical protein